MNLEREEQPKLTCPIVRDLLPLYLEGLTSPQTNRALERHLEECPGCANYRDALAAPMPEPEEQALAAEKEPDYLKTIRRKGLRRTVVAVLAAVLVLAAAGGIQLFFIGSPAQAEDFVWTVEQQKEDSLTFSVNTPSSATAFRGWKVERQGDIIQISARRTLASSLFGGYGQIKMDIPLEGVQRVELCGATIWQDGLLIPRETWLAWQAATPYVGDAPALTWLAHVLNVDSLCGSFSSSLQTDQPPYGWTLHFDKIPQDAALLDQQMERLAYQMLALVGNLEQVRWTYPQYGGQQVSRTFTLQQAEWQLSTYCGQEENLKEYSQSPEKLEQLRQIIAAEDFPINP